MALETLLTEKRAAPSFVFVSIVDDNIMCDLNRQFRNTDSSTDVLSFESGVAGDVLGDIVINVDQAEAQATARGDSRQNELALLALHGGLHLVGMRDDTDEQRHEMLTEMYRLANKAGLKCKPDWQTMDARIDEGGKN